MRKRRMFLIVLACLGVPIILAAFFRGEREPSYNGQPLSSWVSGSYAHIVTRSSLDAEAVQAIGTNAIPFLLEWMRYEPPPEQRDPGRDLPAFVLEKADLRSPVARSRRAQNAVRGFGLLGSNAYPAIPELVSMAKDESHPNTARHAIVALSGMGMAALPYFSAALAETNQPFRDAIITSMGRRMASDVGSNRCLSAIQPALHDPCLEVRVAASNTAGFLTPRAETATPSY